MVRVEEAILRAALATGPAGRDDARRRRRESSSHFCRRACPSEAGLWRPPGVAAPARACPLVRLYCAHGRVDGARRCGGRSERDSMLRVSLLDSRNRERRSRSLDGACACTERGQRSCKRRGGAARPRRGSSAGGRAGGAAPGGRTAGGRRPGGPGPGGPAPEERLAGGEEKFGENLGVD